MGETCNRILKVLGKQDGEIEFSDLLSYLGESPEIVNVDEDTYYRFVCSGFSLVAGQGFLRLAIFDLIPPDISHKPYLGDLPEGILISDRRDVVQNKMMQKPFLSETAHRTSGASYLDYYELKPYYTIAFDFDSVKQKLRSILVEFGAHAPK